MIPLESVTYSMTRSSTKPSDFEIDLLNRLKTNHRFACYYLDELLTDRVPGYQERLLTGLRRMAEAYGISKLTQRIGRSPKALYKSLSPKGNPTLGTLLAILDVLGVQLRAEQLPNNNVKRKKKAA